MIRRITLTLGMGVAIISLGAGTAPSFTARAATASAGRTSIARSANHDAPRGPHRSGYIVASS